LLILIKKFALNHLRILATIKARSHYY